MDTFGQITSDGEAAELQRLGVHNVRINVGWREFQQSNCNDQEITSGLNFAPFDAKILRAAEHNITIVADIYGSRVPGGCENGTDVHQFPKSGTQLYKDFTFAESGGYKGGFVWQVVQRYGVNGSFWYEHPGVTPHPIKDWEVWNETNLSENNPEGKVQPQLYAKLLIDTSKAIRGAQSALVGQSAYNVGTRVLFGGLWGDSKYANGVSVSWTLGKYLEEIYSHPVGYTAEEAHNSFDGLSYHPYALHGTAADVQGAVSAARTTLNNDGDAGKTLWLTELGWPVGFNQISPSHNAQEQSELLSSALSWIYANQASLKAEYAATFVYQDHANPCTSVNCWAEYAGIKDQSGANRPAWCAIANLIGSGACLASNLFAVAMNHTGEHHTGIHVLNGATEYQTWLTQRETPLGETNPSEWRFLGWP